MKFVLTCLVLSAVGLASAAQQPVKPKIDWTKLERQFDHGLAEAVVFCRVQGRQAQAGTQRFVKELQSEPLVQLAEELWTVRDSIDFSAITTGETLQLLSDQWHRLFDVPGTPSFGDR